MIDYDEMPHNITFRIAALVLEFMKEQDDE